MSFEHQPSGKVMELKLLYRVYKLVSEYRFFVIFSLVLTIALAIIGPAVPWLIQRTIDYELLNYDYKGLLNNSLIILGLLALQGVIFYLQSYYTGWLGQQAIHELRRKVFNHISSFRMKVFDRTPVGTMITRTIADVETVANIFAEGLINITGDLLQIIVILGIMIYTDWQLTLISLTIFPLLLISAYIFKEKVKFSFQEVRTAVARLNAFLQEHITGMLIVKVFNREDVEMKRFKEINAEHRDANIRSVMYYSVFFPVIEVLSAISIALIVWWGAKGVLQGISTFGTIVSFILYINLLFRPIRQVADKFNTLQMGMVASERIFRVLDMTDTIPNQGDLKRSLEGHVEFKNVWFAYEGENWVLKDISLQAKPGQTLAFVGYSGAGKTSVSSLINRLYEYQKGSILIDGTPVEEYDLTNLRKQIAVVLQDVFLFSDTIENNIKLYNQNISREQIMEAARMVGADKFIERLPGGLDYQVQERGSTLSTGQRQLISFIRAIIQNPAILILDEATSSIDHETEEMIQEATNVLLKGRTSIVIAHRLSTIQDADQIIVMSKGQIEEQGTHHELLAREGLYRKLYELQFSELAL